MTIEDARALPVAEKMQLMEVLLQDLRDRYEKAEIPDEHKALLDARRTRVDAGESTLHDWDQVKAAIGRS